MKGNSNVNSNNKPRTSSRPSEKKPSEAKPERRCRGVKRKKRERELKREINKAGR